MSAYFGKEGFTIETRILRDLGKDLANHFIGRFNDRGRSGSRVYDPDTWDMWVDIVRWKLQKKNRPQISELLSEKYGHPLQAKPFDGIKPAPLPVPPPDYKQLSLKEMRYAFSQWKRANNELRGAIRAKNRTIGERNQSIQDLKDTREIERDTHRREIEIRHELYLVEKQGKEEAEKQLHSLDVVAPKRKELLSKAAKLHPFWDRKERNQILDELTSLELNPEAVEEEGG